MFRFAGNLQASNIGDGTGNAICGLWWLLNNPGLPEVGVLHQNLRTPYIICSLVSVGPLRSHKPTDNSVPART